MPGGLDQVSGWWHLKVGMLDEVGHAGTDHIAERSLCDCARCDLIEEPVRTDKIAGETSKHGVETKGGPFRRAFEGASRYLSDRIALSLDRPSHELPCEVGMAFFILRNLFEGCANVVISSSRRAFFSEQCRERLDDTSLLYRGDHDGWEIARSDDAVDVELARPQLFAGETRFTTKHKYEGE